MPLCLSGSGSFTPFLLVGSEIQECFPLCLILCFYFSVYFFFLTFHFPFLTASQVSFFSFARFSSFHLFYPEQCVGMLVSEALRSIDSSSYNGVQHLFFSFFCKKTIKIFKNLMLVLILFFNLEMKYA